MDMKITGGIEYTAHDGDTFEIEVYMPDDQVYVCVQHCGNDWGYSVSDKSKDEYPRTIMASYNKASEYEDSDYMKVLNMLRAMICVMELAND